ncbi:hypothetical protein LCGC14_0195560 [marine sediment metagenome]|uniref:Uncharacterized protein n=1 Tax=marine sediment metagenome TaxID=412755 RepID=A0A0F9XNE0_9ZZZZ
MDNKIQTVIKSHLKAVKDELIKDLLELHKQITAKNAHSSAAQESWTCGCYYDPEANVDCLMHLLLELFDIEYDLP